MANKSKKIRIGTMLMSKKNINGKEVKSYYIGLGSNHNKDPKWNYSVELTVKDSSGKVVYTQKDGFISLSDPRTLPKELFEAGVISEERYTLMQESAAKIPEKIKFALEISPKS